MLTCQHVGCDFEVRGSLANASFHFGLHDVLVHSQFDPISTRNLILEILTKMAANDEATVVFKINKSEFMQSSSQIVSVQACFEFVFTISLL